MAEIKVDSTETIKKLREITKSEELFPYADYDINDPNVYVTMTIYRKDPETGLKYGSREYDEEHDGKFILTLRTQLFQELLQFNPDSELIEKLKLLGITLKFPQRGGWFK